MKKNCFDRENSYDTREIDVPLNSSMVELCQKDSPTKHISPQKADSIEENLERQAKIYDKLDKHIYKRLGFYLLIGCGLVYFIVVIADMILLNLCEWQPSSLVNGFVELLKFVISTLIGFVFSETLKSKNDH